MFKKIRARWRLAGILEQAERNGQSVIIVPFDLVAEVKADIYIRQVKRASAKWDARTAEVSLEQWRAAIDNDSDEHT